MDPLGELLFSLKFGGFWSYYRERKYHKVILQMFQHFVLHISCVLNIYSAYRDGFKESMSSTLPFFAPVITLSVCHFALYIRNNEIKILLESFQNMMTFHQEIRSIFNKYYIFALKYGKVIRNSLIIIWSTFFTLPPVMELIYYLLGFTEFPIDLPTVTSFLFMEKSQLQHCFCGLFGSLWDGCAGISHFGFLVSNFNILIYFYVELKVFKYQIENDYGQLLLDNKKRDETFREIISRQQSLMKLHLDIKSAIALSLAVQNIVVASSNCFYLYAITSGGSAEKRILFTYGLLLFSIDAFVCCYAADLIESEGVAIFYAIYGLPWFKLPPNDRKTFKLIALQARQSTIIKFKGVSPTNVESIGQILQATYSYFMLLKSF